LALELTFTVTALACSANKVDERVIFVALFLLTLDPVVLDLPDLHLPTHSRSTITHHTILDLTHIRLELPRIRIASRPLGLKALRCKGLKASQVIGSG
jgi:hypothetical protein